MDNNNNNNNNNNNSNNNYSNNNNSHKSREAAHVYLSYFKDSAHGTVQMPCQ